MPGMRRREFITLLGGAAAGWPLAAHAQQGERMRRIGVLMGLVASDPEAQSRVAAFEHGLRELGWVKGRNLRIEYRWAGGGDDVLRNHASELIAMAPDVILANSTPVTAAAAEAEPDRANRVHAGDRPGRRRPRAEPGASGRQCHRLHQLRVLDRNQMAGAAQADCAAASRGSRSSSTRTARRSPTCSAAGRGRGAFLLGDADRGRVRATDDLDRVFDALARGANGGLIVVSDLGMTDHRDATDRAGGASPRAGGLPVSLLCHRAAV